VDGGIEVAVGRCEVEDFEVGAHRLRGQRGGDARHMLCDLAHVDEDEHPDEFMPARLLVSAVRRRPPNTLVCGPRLA
jgi:hypothetical protein